MMLPFHKGDRITTAAGGATLLGFSAAVKGSMGIIPADAGNGKAAQVEALKLRKSSSLVLGHRH